MKRSVFAVAALAMASTFVHAAEPKKPYFGVLFGQADITRDIDTFTSVNAEEFTWGLNIGVNVTSNLAFEFGILKPKSLGFSFEDGGDLYEAKDRITAFALSVLPTLPVTDRTSLFIRLGAVRAEEDIEAWVNGDRAGSVDDHSTEFLMGAGVNFFVDRAQLRFEYMRAKFEAGKVGLAAVSVNWFLPTSP